MRNGVRRLEAIVLAWTCLTACRANAPSGVEEKVAAETKKVTIEGKDWKNPIPDGPGSVREGARHFEHHCQVCHGLDGQATGVPFADKMSPPVADLAAKEAQDYTDGQL